MRIVGILFFIGILVLGCGHSVVESESSAAKSASVPSETKNYQNECGQINFHYIVTQNNLLAESAREINVFMEPKAFDEKNLQILFKHLSNTFSKPDRLVINVETEWSRLALPDECTIGISGAPFDSTENDFHRAIFRRFGEKSEFSYNPTLKTAKWKKVRLEVDRVKTP